MTMKNLALAFVFSVVALGAAPVHAAKQHITQAAESEAQCVIRILIDKRGNPIEIEMVRSSGDRDTDRSVIHAARTYKIVPQAGQKKAAPGWYELPVKLVQD